MVGAWPLVGRADELAVASAALATTPGGVVIAGPAGVGKSRVLGELLDRAAAEGRATLLCRANPAASAIPFGAFDAVLPEPFEGDHPLTTMTRALEQRLGAEFVLGVDDAHALDDLSAALCHRLAQTPGISLVLGLRSDERTPEAIDWLWKDELVTRLDLQPLAPVEIHQLLEIALGGPVAAAASSRFYETSAGNVLWLRELLHDAQRQGALVEADGLWTWSGTVSAGPRLAALVEARIGALDDDERALIGLVSVLEPMPMGVAEEGVGLPVVARLEQRGLLLVTAEGNLHLGHPLYGDVVRTQWPVAIRRELVRSAVRLLADSSEQTGAPALLRLGQLHLVSGEPVDATLLAAGARAANDYGDLTLGARLAEAALRIDAGSFAARYELGQSSFGLGRFAGASDVLAELVGCEPDEATIAALAHARSLSLHAQGGSVAGQAPAVLAEALGRLRDGPSRAVVRGAEARLAMHNHDHLGAAERAAPLLVEPGVPDAVRLQAAQIVGTTKAYRGEPDEAARLGAEMLPLARSLAERSRAPFGWTFSVRWLGLVNGGHLDDAWNECTELIESRAMGTDLSWVGRLHLSRGRVELLRGQPRSATASLREAVAALRVADSTNALTWALAALAAARALDGDHDEAAAFLAAGKEAEAKQAWRLFDNDRQFLGAQVYAARGEAAKACKRLSLLAEGTMLFGVPTFAVKAWYEAWRLGAPDVADRLLDAASRYRCALTDAVTAHVTASLRGDGAALAAAGEQLAALGMRAAAAEAATHAAVAHHRAGHRASSLAATQRAEQLLDQCEGYRPPGLVTAGLVDVGLTAREREIVGYAARGLSNRQIADELVMSIRTVEGHLLRAFAKLGINRREELSGLA